MHINSPQLKWQKALERRKEENSYRELQIVKGLSDFSSNDYLGLANNAELQAHVTESYNSIQQSNKLGSTGSRLISGNNEHFEQTESFLAKIHNAESALLFNSGYMANLAVFSTLPQRGDTILFDELSHACIKDGLRLSLADHYPFLHNNLESLENKLKKAKGNVFVGVESVYSMDGDFAPLKELTSLCKKYGATLIVDEAHSTGVYGKNGAGLVCELGLENNIPVRIHTFGKAMGCHGAAVVGDKVLKDYLVNFARPFIFTTAMSLHSSVSIFESYQYLSQNTDFQENIKNKIQKFNLLLGNNKNKIYSDSPIHALLFPGNNLVKQTAISLREKGFDIRPILSPTVKKGSERLRICLHTFNTDEEIESLCSLLNNFRIKP